jgi:tetratricopeptide (TPR) repeat protein
MRSRRAERAITATVALVTLAAAARPADGQRVPRRGAPPPAQPVAPPRDTTPSPERWLARAFEHEDAGRLDSAVVWFARLLRTPDRLQGLLGLERSLAMQGRRRDVAAWADTVLRLVPTDRAAHAVRVRALTGRDDRAAFRDALAEWSRAAPGDVEPWREGARALLDAGQPAAADSVADAGVLAVGSTRGLAAELGQVRARLGRWEAAAQAFREAIREQEWLQESVAYALRGTPPDRRATTTAALLAAPVAPAARRAAATLRTGWGDVAGAWEALKPLPRNDSSATAWRAFADQARRSGAPKVAAEAYVSALEVRPSGAVALDAAEAALEARDATLALDLGDLAARQADSAGTATRRAVVRTRALAALGRLDDAATIVRGLEDPLARRRAAGALAEGYALAGQLTRAGEIADREGLAVEDDASAAWVALWRGDLAAARRGLGPFAEGARPAARAMALLARTRAERAPLTGQAFLAVARGDTVAAMSGFVRAADEVPDAAALLRLEAARLADARRDASAAGPLWAAIIAADPTSPEAAEARLARARAAIRRGEGSTARADLEALLLEQPGSALVPQARRELERLAGRVP